MKWRLSEGEIATMVMKEQAASWLASDQFPDVYWVMSLPTPS